MYSLRHLLVLLAGTTIGLAGLLAPCAAYEYQPLESGWQWIYDNPSGGIQTMSITGEREVLGVTTKVRLQVEDTQTYENYWTRDAAGGLFLHGAYNYDGFGIAYAPPIQMVNAPLFLGKTWITVNIYTYGLDGNPDGGPPFDYPLRVYFEGAVTVPAGEFYAYGVGYDIGPRVIFSRGGKTYDLLGRSVTAGDLPRTDNTTDWYTDGVGEVMFGYVYGDIYRLRSFDTPVPTQATTWGRVRALYR
jgi:hypothetical protein